MFKFQLFTGGRDSTNRSKYKPHAAAWERAGPGTQEMAGLKPPQPGEAPMAAEVVFGTGLNF